MLDLKWWGACVPEIHAVLLDTGSKEGIAKNFRYSNGAATLRQVNLAAGSAFFKLQQFTTCP